MTKVFQTQTDHKPTQEVLAASGDKMVAEAFRQISPDVLPVYPITPQTIIVEEFDRYVSEGRVHTEFISVESEHSALAAAIGASAAGARTVTATASQGLAYMWEELYAAAGMRLPIIMANANRALSAPINIHGDHSDIMGARDAGWLMFFAEQAQEAYDNVLIATRVAENKEVMLPAVCALDGFITSHALERCELMDDKTVASFVGEYQPEHSLLDTENPVSYGMFANLGSLYMETKLAQRIAQQKAYRVCRKVGDEWEKLSGRPFDFVKTFEIEDAERVIVLIGSAAGNVRHVVRELREKGERVGLVSLRVFRPLPVADLVRALSRARSVAVLDRAETIGALGGPLFETISSVMYSQEKRPYLSSYIYGLGGADVSSELIEEVFEELKTLPKRSAQGDVPVSYKGNRAQGYVGMIPGGPMDKRSAELVELHRQQIFEASIQATLSKFGISPKTAKEEVTDGKA